MDQHRLDQSDLSLPSKCRRREIVVLTTGRVVAQHSLENQVINEELLCDDCRAVDWSSIRTSAADGSLHISGGRDLKLPPVNATLEELRNSSCKICAILSNIKDPCLDGTQCVLMVLPLSWSTRYGIHHLSHYDSAKRSAVLGIMRAGTYKRFYEGRHLAVSRIDDLEASRIAPSSIDYNKFKDLLKTCEKEHKRCCMIEPHPNVLDLEVIDTKTQEVIKAPDGCKYLALSYVWGKEAGDSSIHNIRNAPPVIRDAISVTNSMGYSYLWVDRYCINTSDSIEKHRMISQMDRVYANASLTIIAAADGDTELGLCGISMLRQLRRVNIQDVTLMDLPFPAEDLTSSKWATRGWTYQEGYLSRRRLIFTKTQVLFLCNGMYATESLQTFLSTTCYSNDTSNFHYLIPRFQATPQRRRFSAVHLLHQIQEYSKRELTRPGDSLNAILGVLNFYANNLADSTSPVLRLPWGLIANKKARKNSFSLHFLWHHDKPPTRRAEFPSWSWTGWGGPLKFSHLEVILQPGDALRENPDAYLDWELSMRDEDGRIWKMYDLVWKEFEARNAKNRLYQPGPKQLQVSCLVIPVSFQYLGLTEDQKRSGTKMSIHDTGKLYLSGRNLPNGAHPTLQIWKGIYVGQDRAMVKLDQQIEQNDCILGLLFAGRKDTYYWEYCHCLLVRQAGKGLYERIGLFFMHDLADSRTDQRNEQRVYFDAMGNVLDRFTISDKERRYPFADTAERRVICLI